MSSVSIPNRGQIVVLWLVPNGYFWSGIPFLEVKHVNQGQRKRAGFVYIKNDTCVMCYSIHLPSERRDSTSDKEEG